MGIQEAKQRYLGELNKISHLYDKVEPGEVKFLKGYARAQMRIAAGCPKKAGKIF